MLVINIRGVRYLLEFQLFQNVKSHFASLVVNSVSRYILDAVAPVCRRNDHNGVGSDHWNHPVLRTQKCTFVQGFGTGGVARYKTCSITS